jgi:hypothetical protein
MFREKRSRRNEGQALVEMIVVMPVLLLLLLAAADMGKLFVISGKSEISARYIALSHFREAPFGDAYPTYTARQEIERLFFDDALDDSGLPDGMSSEADDPDVTYEELGDLDYVPDDHGDPLLIWLWAWVNATNQLFPVRGARSTFTYDLPFFPYGREDPMEATRDLQGAPSGSSLAASYDAVGNFVMLAESFSGAEGEQLRLALEAAHLIAGAELGVGYTVGILVGLWLIYLP